MRTSTPPLVIVVSALLLAACSATPDPAAPPSSDVAPTDTEAADPAAEEPSDAASVSDVATDLPNDVLLPASAWEATAGSPDVSEGVVAWRLPESCDAGEPTTATSMLTATLGDGAQESPVGVQQVALFADADAASVEAGRLTTVMSDCADAGPDEAAGGTTYVAEAVDVGTQGSGLATSYYGDTGGDLDDALGTYLATTRRGTAVTLVAVEGGESTVGVARENVVGNEQSAWELLCRYDSAGC